MCSNCTGAKTLVVDLKGYGGLPHSDVDLFQYFQLVERASAVLPLANTPSRSITRVKRIYWIFFYRKCTISYQKPTFFKQHFTSHFIGNFFTPASYFVKQNMWAHHLPAILVSSPFQAVEYATKAATKTLDGIKTENDSIKTEACRWYVKGIRLQRNELRRVFSFFFLFPQSPQGSLTLLLF